MGFPYSANFLPASEQHIAFRWKDGDAVKSMHSPKWMKFLGKHAHGQATKRFAARQLKASHLTMARHYSLKHAAVSCQANLWQFTRDKFSVSMIVLKKNMFTCAFLLVPVSHLTGWMMNYRPKVGSPRNKYGKRGKSCTNDMTTACQIITAQCKPRIENHQRERRCSLWKMPNCEVTCSLEAKKERALEPDIAIKGKGEHSEF